ncbi:MAG: hypothetical protein MUE85_00315 [Microscillaceae bacterium]|jgi:hypothetical protein|nr:hypothetical protein [Microscillaceae bacterium]
MANFFNKSQTFTIYVVFGGIGLLLGLLLVYFLHKKGMGWLTTIFRLVIYPLLFGLIGTLAGRFYFIYKN